MSTDAQGTVTALIPDPSLEVRDGGRLLVGGSPLTVLRFAQPIDLNEVRSATVANRLLDTGMAHPIPVHTPFTSNDVTVIIPVYQDESGLSDTLRGLSQGVSPPGSVIVVDDASDDPNAVDRAVARVVADSGVQNVTVLHHQHNQGPGAARNEGLAATTTSLVAFLDAGCVPEPAWLEPLLAHFSDTNLAAVAPRVVADPSRFADVHRSHLGPISKRIAAYETSRSPLDLGPLPARVAPGTRVSYVPSACLLGRTAVIRSAGGFDGTMRVGEDVDLVWRLCATHRVRYEPRSIVRHDLRVRATRFLRRRFLYGTSAGPLAARHPGSLAPLRVSPWTAVAWAAATLGRPKTGGGIALISVGLLGRKLRGVESGLSLSLRLGGRGNLAAGRLFANAARREWWPLALLGVAVGSRSLRRSVAVAFVIVPLLEWTPRSGLDPGSWVVLRLFDDLAYGSGVWRGCVAQRTISPLVPSLKAGRYVPPTPL